MDMSIHGMWWVHVGISTDGCMGLGDWGHFGY